MLNIRHQKILFLLILMTSFHVRSQVEYDTSFTSYLNAVRETCISKDTLKLHALLGDNMYTDTCFKEEINDSLMRWDVFKEKFELMDTPDKSDFWEHFIQKSGQSFHYDSILNSYDYPEYYFKKNGYVIGYPIRGIFLKVIEKDTIALLVGSQLTSAVPIQFIPKKIWSNYVNPYNLWYVNDAYYLCLENGIELGFVSSKDVVNWNYHLLFDKINEKWQLVYYEYCN